MTENLKKYFEGKPKEEVQKLWSTIPNKGITVKEYLENQSQGEDWD